MECPNCGDRNTTVKDSRKVEMNVFRTRHCNKCGNTFYTEEISIDDDDTVRSYMSAIKQEQRKKGSNKYNGENRKYKGFWH